MPQRCTYFNKFLGHEEIIAAAFDAEWLNFLDYLRT
jgi:hypothetical protein